MLNRWGCWMNSAWKVKWVLTRVNNIVSADEISDEIWKSIKGKLTIHEAQKPGPCVHDILRIQNMIQDTVAVNLRVYFSYFRLILSEYVFGI